MKFIARLSLILCLLTLVAQVATKSMANNGAWLEVEIGIIGTSSEDILNAAMERVEEESLSGLIIKLDTPGGALENTRKMVKTMMGADFPVIVWVGPAGSRAGSAGAFITLAGHVAAMAPGTNIGAAHPIQASGKDVDNEEVERKVMNDTLAFIETIAETRGRNAEMARSFVMTSVSITEKEALENNVIDLVAGDLDSLMEQINGKEVTVANDRKVTLATAGAARLSYELTFRQKLLEILSNPNLFYLFFMAGLIGIGYELTHPGALFPGVLGGIAMILALIATSVLPVSWGAAALILLGVALLVAEAFVPSFGILGIGGLAAFFVGSAFLVDPGNTQGLRIHWSTFVPVVLVTGAAFAFLGYLIVKSETRPVASGSEGMVGLEGQVMDAFDGNTGQIKLAGSIWTARIPNIGEAGLEKGDKVRVTKVDGLTVEVEVIS